MDRLPEVLGLAGMLLFLSGCAAPVLLDGGPCRMDGPPVALPPETPESSGVAPGGITPGGTLQEGSHPEFFWTHNDSGWDAELFAVAADGSLLGRVRVAGARNRDWEDLAAGPCGDRRCLYIADTGDNLEVRDDPAIYRIPEPDPADSVSAPAIRFPLSFPHGPRDVEALVLLPDEEVLLISKGGGHAVEVYRSPGPLSRALEAAGGGPIELQRIQRLTSGPVGLPRMVTGAAATADGALVAVRTYETLQFYRPGEDGRLQALSGGLVNLRPLDERQGEAVSFLAGDRLVLTSEAGPFWRRGQMSFLACRVEGVRW